MGKGWKERGKRKRSREGKVEEKDLQPGKVRGTGDRKGGVSQERNRKGSEVDGEITEREESGVKGGGSRKEDR